jgi:hypothetical protein
MQDFNEALEDGKYTISDISGALGMNHEEKTMSRVLNELKKCHPQIMSSAVRNGRVFQYKYYLKDVVASPGKNSGFKSTKLRKRESKEEEKVPAQLVKAESDVQSLILD